MERKRTPTAPLEQVRRYEDGDRMPNYEDFSDEPEGIASGPARRVRHPQFGLGTILERTGRRGDEGYGSFFQGGKKKLSVKYGKSREGLSRRKDRKNGVCSRSMRGGGKDEDYRQEVEHVAKLARLRFDEAEMERLLTSSTLSWLYR